MHGMAKRRTVVCSARHLMLPATMLLAKGFALGKPVTEAGRQGIGKIRGKAAHAICSAGPVAMGVSPGMPHSAHEPS